MSAEAPTTERKRRLSILPELGTTGLRTSGGQIFEQRDPEFNGRPWRETIKRMADGDPVIGAFLLAIELLIRNAAVRVEPASKANLAKRAQRLVATGIDDMAMPFSAFLGEALTLVPYGWSFFETVYKDRRGPSPRPFTDSRGNRRTPPSSKYNDGLIGWHKLAPRPQSSLLRWEFDKDGGLKGMWQYGPGIAGGVFLPIERCLLFRARQSKNNPEGISMLRNAWRPWYMKRNIEQIEAMGIERDLNGYPVLYLPADYLKMALLAEGVENDPEAEAEIDAEMLAFVRSMQALVTNIKRDASEGALVPQIYDPVTKLPLVKLELLSSGGTRTFNTDAIIARYDQRIAMSALADFILLGTEKVGSFALSATKSDLFTATINAITDAIAAVFNTYAIPRLMDINAIDRSLAPTLSFGRITKPDLAILGGFLKDAAAAGMTFFPSRPVEDAVYDLAGLPKPTEEERAQREQNRTAAQARIDSANPPAPAQQPTDGQGGGRRGNPPARNGGDNAAG